MLSSSPENFRRLEMIFDAETVNAFAQLAFGIAAIVVAWKTKTKEPD
jgi:hypothetical protein